MSLWSVNTMDIKCQEFAEVQKMQLQSELLGTVKLSKSVAAKDSKINIPL